MLALLILPILVSGFIVCNKDLELFYKLHRFQGQHLYLRCAWLGSICFLITTFFALLLNHCAPSKLEIGTSTVNIDLVNLLSAHLAEVIGGEAEGVRQVSWYLVLSASSIGFAYLWPVFSMLYLRCVTGSLTNATIQIRKNIVSDSLIETALYSSFMEERPIMLSLENNQVYVGIISKFGEPTENRGMAQEIGILPIISGYRDETTKTVNFNLDEYSGVEVIIRQDRIFSSSWFDIELYETLSTDSSNGSGFLSIPSG